MNQDSKEIEDREDWRKIWEGMEGSGQDFKKEKEAETKQKVKLFITFLGLFHKCMNIYEVRSITQLQTI